VTVILIKKKKIQLLLFGEQNPREVGGKKREEKGSFRIRRKNYEPILLSRTPIGKKRTRKRATNKGE